MKKINLILMSLSLLLLVSCAVIEEEPTDIDVMTQIDSEGNLKITSQSSEGVYVIEKPVETFVSGLPIKDQIEYTTLLDKAEFNEKSFDEKVSYIDNARFYSCTIIEDFCAVNADSTTGCDRFCSGRYGIQTDPQILNSILMLLIGFGIGFILFGRKK